MEAGQTESDLEDNLTCFGFWEDVFQLRHVNGKALLLSALRQVSLSFRKVQILRMSYRKLPAGLPVQISVSLQTFQRILSPVRFEMNASTGHQQPQQLIHR